MDGKRFDAIARALAAWSTRRKFLSGLSGAAAGSALGHVGSATAQGNDSTPTDNLPSDCVDDKGLDDNPHIVSTSNYLYDRMPNPENYLLKENPKYDRPQLPEFIEQIRCLLAQGKQADGWGPPQRAMFMNQLRTVITSFSMGFTGAFFKSESPATPSGDAPAGIRAQVTGDEKSDCKPSGCTADALSTALGCWQGCYANSDCYSKCFNDFVTTYFIGTETTKACVDIVNQWCTGDCCGGCRP
jgi:hypothetical protein